MMGVIQKAKSSMRQHNARVVRMLKSFSLFSAHAMTVPKSMTQAKAMVSISFLALLVGMKMQSSRATVVASILIVCFTQGNIGEFTLANSVPFYLLLFVLAVVSVSAAIHNVERKDV